MRLRNTKRLVKQAQMYNTELFRGIGITPILGALTTAAITVLVLNWLKYNGKINLPTFAINWIAFSIFSGLAAASMLAYTGTYVYQEKKNQDIDKCCLANITKLHDLTDPEYTKYNAYTVSNPISIIAVLSIACVGIGLDIIAAGMRGLSSTNPEEADMSTEMNTSRIENISSADSMGI